MFSLTRFSALASGDILPAIDVSNSSQNAHGSLLSITITDFFATIPVPVVVTSASAAALAVGLTGATNPAFSVDASTASQAAGLKVTGAVAAGTVAVVVISSDADASLTVNAKGTGTIGIGTVSTGRVTITPVTTIVGALSLASGTLTASAPAIALTQTWNSAGVTFQAATFIITDTASAAGSNFLDFQTVALGSVWKVTKAGATNASAAFTSTINQNAASSGYNITNTTNGTLASARMTWNGPSFGATISVYPAAYTTSGTAMADTAELSYNGPGGIQIATNNAAAVVRVYSGSAALAATFGTDQSAVFAFTVAATNAAAKTVATLTGNTGNGYGMEIRGQAGSTKYNFFIGAQITADNGFEIIPSTATDGHTFTTSVFKAYQNASIVLGTAAIATNATDGFLYMTSCAGTPTGAPTAFTGRVAWVYDSTNNIIYVYNGAWKKTVALT